MKAIASSFEDIDGSFTDYGMSAPEAEQLYISILNEGMWQISMLLGSLKRGTRSVTKKIVIGHPTARACDKLVFSKLMPRAFNIAPTLKHTILDCDSLIVEVCYSASNCYNPMSCAWNCFKTNYVQVTICGYIKPCNCSLNYQESCPCRKNLENLVYQYTVGMRQLN